MTEKTRSATRWETKEEQYEKAASLVKTDDDEFEKQVNRERAEVERCEAGRLCTSL